MSSHTHESRSSEKRSAAAKERHQHKRNNRTVFLPPWQQPRLLVEALVLLFVRLRPVPYSNVLPTPIAKVCCTCWPAKVYAYCKGVGADGKPVSEKECAKRERGAPCLRSKPSRSGFLFGSGMRCDPPKPLRKRERIEKELRQA